MSVCRTGLYQDHCKFGNLPLPILPYPSLASDARKIERSHLFVFLLLTDEDGHSDDGPEEFPFSSPPVDSCSSVAFIDAHGCGSRRGYCSRRR